MLGVWKQAMTDGAAISSQKEPPGGLMWNISLRGLFGSTQQVQFSVSSSHNVLNVQNNLNFVNLCSW